MRAMLTLALLLIVAALVGCKPQTVREPYPVEMVREVVKPIPSRYTDRLPTPTLPENITVKDLVLHVKEWQAFGETVNEHRAKVRELSKE